MLFVSVITYRKGKKKDGKKDGKEKGDKEKAEISTEEPVKEPLKESDILLMQRFVTLKYCFVIPG